MASQNTAPARRRREAAMRLPPLGDGQRDPIGRPVGQLRPRLTEPEGHDPRNCRWCYSWIRNPGA